jgi:small acid-soluble spore protein D (minor alpha/beta-type SASP)
VNPKNKDPNRIGKRRLKNMARSNGNRVMVPEAREALNKFKMETASEVGVTLNQGYNGHLTSQQAGSIGGQMVKKMIAAYENGLK